MLELDPRYASAYANLGSVFLGGQRYEDAEGLFRRALELDPRQYDTLYNLGTLLTKLNRFEEAIPYLEQFVETAPRDRYGEDVSEVRNLAARLRARRSGTRSR